jgi:hypothetical protein
MFAVDLPVSDGVAAALPHGDRPPLLSPRARTHIFRNRNRSPLAAARSGYFIDKR